jgi:hypothetical protein
VVESIIGVGAMDKAEADEETLTFDITDEALERAANAEQAYTLAYCTVLAGTRSDT